MITKDKEKQKIVTFEELKSGNICHFCLEGKDFNDESTMKIFNLIKSAFIFVIATLLFHANAASTD